MAENQNGRNRIISQSDAERVVELEKNRIMSETNEQSIQEQILETLLTISEQLSELTVFLRNTR